MSVHENKAYNELFPEKIACKITITTNKGQKMSIEKEDYEGMFSRPMSVEKLSNKFRRITAPLISQEAQDNLIDTILDLDKRDIRDLTEILSSSINLDEQSRNLETRIPIET